MSDGSRVSLLQSPWHPTASLHNLRLVASVRASVHAWMAKHDVLEVVTPSLSCAGATDPHVQSFMVTPGPTSPDGVALQQGWLHTSPEFPMKRLLAAYRTDIYQIASVFRVDEAGRYHNAEFSLLEWYRVGFDHHRLMQDVAELLQTLCEQCGKTWHAPSVLSYQEAIRLVLPDLPALANLTVSDIERVFSEHRRSYPSAIGDDLDAALVLLLDDFVLPSFPDDRASFVVDYPASQAALARVGSNAAGEPVAERFEVYWGTVELANAFHELSDAGEQRRRFQNDLRIRQQLGASTYVSNAALDMSVDEHLLQALEHGLPDCAGVALGMDRLMMVLLDADHIEQVLSFPAARA